MNVYITNCELYFTSIDYSNGQQLPKGVLVIGTYVSTYVFEGYTLVGDMKLSCVMPALIPVKDSKFWNLF